jgi:hypothetical protein
MVNYPGFMGAARNQNFPIDQAILKTWVSNIPKITKKLTALGLGKSVPGVLERIKTLQDATTWKDVSLW